MIATLTVVAEDGKTVLAKVPTELYRDFLDSVLVECKSIETYLSSLVDPEHQRALNDYIIHRLAEVDPGYLPVSYE